MDSVKLTVTGMTCSHCENRVQQALAGVSGSIAALVELESGTAEVDYEGTRAKPEDFIIAVREVGYDARVDE